MLEAFASKLMDNNLTSFNKEIYIKEKKLDPYLSFQFQMTCIKEDIIKSNKVSIIIAEVDIPAIAVDIPTSLLSRRIKLNEVIIF